MKTTPLFLASGVAIVAGVSTFFVQHLGKEPQVSCVPDGQATSGFAITKDGKDCALSSDDFRRLWNWQHNSANNLHRIGLVLVLLGIVLLVVALVRRSRARKAARLDGAPLGAAEAPVGANWAPQPQPGQPTQPQSTQPYPAQTYPAQSEPASQPAPAQSAPSFSGQSSSSGPSVTGWPVDPS